MRQVIVRPEAGTYVLLCSVAAPALLEVGRLGRIGLRPGIYGYVGSALGPGGLRARLAHHLRPAKRPHWHIDYLRRRARIARIWYSYGSDRREHQWAAALGALPHGTPVAGFGSSDCDCESHLFCFERPPSVQAFAKALTGLNGGGAPSIRFLRVINGTSNSPFA